MSTRDGHIFYTNKFAPKNTLKIPDAHYCMDIYCIYRTRRNFRGGLIFVLFAGEVDPRKLMRTKIKNYGPSP